MANRSSGLDPRLRSDARRNQLRILRAAADLLATDPAASIQRIADAAQVARPTVYRRYPTREALIDAIRAEAVNEFHATLDDVAANGSTGAEAIEQLIRSLARISADYPVLLEGTPLHPAGNPSDRVAVNELSLLVERFEAHLTRGQHDGSLRDDLPPDVLRHAMFGALSAVLRLRRQRPEAAQPDSTDVGLQVAALLMDGLRPRTPARHPAPDAD